MFVGSPRLAGSKAVRFTVRFEILGEANQMIGPTMNHNEIRRWADSQNAKPAELHQNVFDSEPARLHFVFGDTSLPGDQLKMISWEQFFAVFDLLGLALVYDETPQFEFLEMGETPRQQPPSRPI